MNTAAPPTDRRAVSLLDHCARVAGRAEPPTRARARLEAVLGGELTHRLVCALAGDHAIPARQFVD